MSDEKNETVAVEPTEGQRLWQEYLQKCCEWGQLNHAMKTLESQQREVEKKVELAERDVKSAAHKHREFTSKQQPQGATVQ